MNMLNCNTYNNMLGEINASVQDTRRVDQTLENNVSSRSSRPYSLDFKRFKHVALADVSILLTLFLLCRRSRSSTLSWKDKMVPM